MVSSTALAGNIGGLRTTGNIGGMRSAGNIGGTRSAAFVPYSTARSTARFELEPAVSGTFGSLFRMLLESGALL
jgi:hypothetical protein